MNNKCTYSVTEFCGAHGISRTQFYDLLKMGLGPAIMKIGRRTLITIESAKQWREKLSKQKNEQTVTF